MREAGPAAAAASPSSRAKQVEEKLNNGVAWLKQQATVASYHLQRHLADLRVAEPPAAILGDGRVVLLGHVYEAGEGERVARVLQDVQSRFWFTYRSGFAPIRTTSYTSDAGWGCMLRSGQMILAQALVTLLAGRGWRRGSVRSVKELEPPTAAAPADAPTRTAPAMASVP